MTWKRFKQFLISILIVASLLLALLRVVLAETAEALHWINVSLFVCVDPTTGEDRIDWQVFSWDLDPDHVRGLNPSILVQYQYEKDNQVTDEVKLLVGAFTNENGRSLSGTIPISDTVTWAAIRATAQADWGDGHPFGATSYHRIDAVSCNGSTGQDETAEPIQLFLPLLAGGE